MLGAKEISSRVCDAINSAAFRGADWQNVCHQIVDACPGTYAAILNHSSHTDRLHFAVAAGIEAEHFSSFLTYYASVNPWRRFWQRAPNGMIAVAERDDPVRQYMNTEFYNDWMRQVGDFDASVGMRWEVDDDETIVLPVHYSLKRATHYDLLLEQVMGDVRDCLANAAQLTRFARRVGEKHAIAASLVDCHEAIAFVMDSNLTLLEANEKAERALTSQDPIRLRAGRIFMQDERVHRQTAILLQVASNGLENLHRRLVLHSRDAGWVLSLNQLPFMSSGLLRIRPQFLCQIRALSSRHQPNPALLVEAFHLTTREIDLCSRLCAGNSLPHAARLSGISYENARQRMKHIYRKTGVSSQADLLMLLRRL